MDDGVGIFKLSGHCLFRHRPFNGAGGIFVVRGPYRRGHRQSDPAPEIPANPSEFSLMLLGEREDPSSSAAVSERGKTMGKVSGKARAKYFVGHVAGLNNFHAGVGDF